MTDATLSAKVTADIADFSKKMGAVKDSIDRLGGSTSGGLGQTNKALGEMEAQVGSIGKILSGGALAAIGKGLTDVVMEPLIGIGKSAVLMADDFERGKLAFTTMLGSAEKATSFLKELQDIAVSTPFEFTQLRDASKRLLAMGLDAKQIPGMIVKIGDAVAGLGSGTQGFDRITNAIGQIQSKGKLQADEMRQLTEAGIGAWDALASHLNITVAEAMERVTKKQVDSATAITAIMDGMGQKFGGLMEKQSATIQGQLSNLQDTSSMILAEIGKELITALKLPEAIAAVGDFARSFLDWFKQLDSGTKQLILVLTGTFAASGPILVAVGAFMAAMTVVTAPLLTGGAIVAGIIAGVTLLILNWQKIKDTGIGLWTSLTGAVKSVIDRMVAGVEQAVARLGAILTGIREKTEAVKQYFKGLYDAVVGHSYIPDMVDSIENNMRRLGTSAMVNPAFAAAVETGKAFRLLQDIGEQRAKNTVDKIAQHMNKLDTVLTAPSRRAAISVENVFRGISMTSADLLEDLQERASYTAGAMIQSLSGAFAGAIQGMTNWSQVGQQILNQLLTNSISMVLTWTTSWLISEAKRLATTEGVNAAIGASTAAVMGAMTATVTAAMTGLKVMMFGVARVALSVVGMVIAAITPVVMGVATVVGTIMEFIGQMLIQLGTAMLDIPFVGWILGGIMIGMGGFAMAAGAALPGIMGGIMSGLAAGVAGLAAAIPAMAAGGIVSRPTLALIGEAGPEAVVPLSRSFGGQPTQQTIIVQLDGQELMRYVTNKLIPNLRLRGAPI